MNVTNQLFVSLPNLYNVKQTKELQSGTAIPISRPQHDLLEISDNGRQLDVITRDIAKLTFPSSPKDDVNEIMKMFKPEAYEKMNHFYEQGNVKEGLLQLLSFAKQLGSHPEWIHAYRKAREE